MGNSFVRRFTYFPSSAELTAIEGVVIVDTPPAGRVEGVGTGCVAVVGEFSDMSYACKVNSSGEVVPRASSGPQAVEVFGGADLVNKLGGFDALLGRFHTEGGNGWVALRNKRFPRLVCVPVDLIRPTSGTTTYGVRLWRDLPTHKSATSTIPIVPVSGAVVEAGREFVAGAVRCRLAQRVAFAGSSPRFASTAGTTVTGALPLSAATRTIADATADFVAAGVSEGDVVVVGSKVAASNSINEIISRSSVVRVVSVDLPTQITVQRMDGTNFVKLVAMDPTDNWDAATADLVYTIYPAEVADTGGINVLADAAGYSVLARPIQTAVPGNVPAATNVTPVVVPESGTATSWISLSGLTMRTHPTGALAYDANVHASNLAATTLLNTRYAEAIDALLDDAEPAGLVNIVVSARTTSSIRAKLRSHVLTASQNGLGRMAVISPSLGVQSLDTVIGTTVDGVGTTNMRHERMVYAWPGCQTFVPEAVGYSITGADTTTVTDGVLDTTFDVWVAQIMANINPELNPGQTDDPVPLLVSSILGFQRGAPTLKLADYVLLKSYGVAGLRIPRGGIPQIQSGITTSLTSGEKNINRRRFADYVQDSLADSYSNYSKALGTQQRKDAIFTETVAFCADLRSENNAAAQRIDSYSVDDQSGNTDTQPSGVHVVITKIKMLETLDTIVAQTEIGPTVVVTVQ